MWNYTSKNSYPDIILHDCMIEKASYKDNNLRFLFDDSGFWIGKDNSDNPHKQILRTGQSEITFVNVDTITIRIFDDVRLFNRTIFTKVKEVSVDTFSSQINSGNIKFEFVDEYYARWDAMFCGYMRFHNKPYFRYAQIEISCDEIIYCWNEIYKDRTW